MTTYELSIGDPWDFSGPDGSNRILVEGLGIVHGPNLPNRQKLDLLLRVLHPFQIEDEEVKLLLASPRHRGSTMDGLLNKSTVISIGRVHANCSLAPGDQYTAADIVFWAIGEIKKVAI
jgi:hypothetical protein